MVDKIWKKKRLEALISQYLREEITYDELDYNLVNMLTDEEYANMKKKMPIKLILGIGKTIAETVTELCR